jgi:hypothetical protein
MNPSKESIRDFVKYNTPEKLKGALCFEKIDALEAELVELNTMRFLCKQKIAECQKILEAPEEEFKKRMLTRVPGAQNHDESLTSEAEFKKEAQAEADKLKQELKEIKADQKRCREEISALKATEEYQMDVLKRHNPRMEN